MPALSNEVLWRKLAGALPVGTTFRTPVGEVKPAIADVPRIGPVRIYLWTLTEDRSREGARPKGEFKIQLIVEHQPRGERGALELGEMLTSLLGYSADFGNFVGWEAELYRDFAYSANVQVKEDLLSAARDQGWAVAAPRPSQGAEEVRVAFSPAHLAAFLAASMEADNRGLTGVSREAFFLSKTPCVEEEQLPADPETYEYYVQEARRRILVTRANRDPRFAAEVKREFDFACAVCLTQLGIVEAAHIVPVTEPEGFDEVWNGLSLCPNHHALFDSRLFVIAPDLVVRVDTARIEFLRESSRDTGVRLVVDHEGQSILPPAFWNENPEARARMERALKTILVQSGME